MAEQVDQIQNSALKLASVCLRASKGLEFESLLLFYSFLADKLRYAIQNKRFDNHRNLIELMDIIYYHFTSPSMKENSKFTSGNLAEISTVIASIFYSTFSTDTISGWTRFLCTYCHYFEESEKFLEAPCRTLLDRLDSSIATGEVKLDVETGDFFAELILSLAKILGTLMDSNRRRKEGSAIVNESQSKLRARLSLFSSTKEETVSEVNLLYHNALLTYIPRLFSSVGSLIGNGDPGIFENLFRKIIIEFGPRNWHVVLLSLVDFIGLEIETRGDEVFMITVPLKTSIKQLSRYFRNDITKEMLSLYQNMRESKIECYQRM